MNVKKLRYWKQGFQESLWDFFNFPLGKSKILLGIVVLVFLVGCTEQPISSNNKPCEDIEAPVCGKINVQCITTPCNPVEETFVNRCIAEQRGAFDIEDGPCEGTTDITNFEECIAAGNPAMESYPRQCRADGKTFVEKI